MVSSKVNNGVVESLGVSTTTIKGLSWKLGTAKGKRYPVAASRGKERKWWPVEIKKTFNVEIHCETNAKEKNSINQTHKLIHPMHPMEKIKT